MELALGTIAIIVIGLVLYYNRKIKSFDANKDGKVDAKDVTAIAANVVEGVKKDLDANKDGKINAKDVKAATSKAKTAVKKAVTSKKPAAKSTKK